MPSSYPALLTLAHAVEFACSALAKATSSPRLDAELLLAHATGVSRSRLRSHPEQLLCAADQAIFEQLLRRRAAGEPIAYLVGEQEFWSLTFEVTSAVLIPRPETELLVELALTRIPAATANPFHILDLGTGSGAIALSLAHERPSARIVATDHSVAALEVARRNAQRLGLTERVTLLAGDWYEPLPGRRFDVIVSNPPYIAQGDPDVAPDVREHEPGVALFAGPDGLEALQTIAGQAPSHLLPGGCLLLEHGWRQGPEVRVLLEKAGFIHVRSHPDLAGHERASEGILPS